ncbi:UNVERIFIED_CONTAM: hypothetical protein Sangu_1616000 [Sesamum angustifolium]|uniref:Uncharacterized protein n=1 Tax=Sesamum angustifolium TaxID=2727405 RepID=A0AAW2MGW9_9LAMI
MKSSAFASTSSSPSVTLPLPFSLTVAGRRASTISSSSKCANADFKLADFLILAGSLVGTSPEAGWVSDLVLLTHCPSSDRERRHPCSAQYFRPVQLLSRHEPAEQHHHHHHHLFLQKRHGFAFLVHGLPRKRNGVVRTEEYRNFLESYLGKSSGTASRDVELDRYGQ